MSETIADACQEIEQPIRESQQQDLGSGSQAEEGTGTDPTNGPKASTDLPPPKARRTKNE